MLRPAPTVGFQIHVLLQELAEDPWPLYGSRFDIRRFGGAGISSGGFSSAWRSCDCSGDSMALKYARLAMNRRELATIAWFRCFCGELFDGSLKALGRLDPFGEIKL